MSEPIILSAEDVPAGLRVVFERRQDRYAHRIEWYDTFGQLERLLESVEGGAEELWPASPVLQEVHLQALEDGTRGALCVGMAGKSHWSVGVRLDSDGRQAVFQAACRVRDVPGNLASTYLAATDASVEKIANLDPSPATLLKATENQRIFLPRSIEPNSPQTVTWDYAVSVESESIQKEPLG